MKSCSNCIANFKPELIRLNKNMIFMNCCAVKHLIIRCETDPLSKNIYVPLKGKNTEFVAKQTIVKFQNVTIGTSQLRKRNPGVA